MEKKNRGEFLNRRGWLWRIAPALLMMILYVGFVVQTTVYSRHNFSYLIITPERYGILAVFIGVAAAATIVFPYRFWIHAVFCLSWGLVRIADGELTTPLLLYLFGSVFLFRMGFFKSHEVLKMFSGVLLLAAAITSQYRLDHETFTQRILHFLLIFLLLFLVVVVFLPEIKIVRKKRRERVLSLKPGRFTEEDAAVLRKILSWEKYEAIAKDEGISVSTMKRRINRIFDMLQISDRASFLSRYAGHTIILEDEVISTKE